MKSERVFLAEWFSDLRDEYVDIPWPMVHEWAGYDVIRWLNKQDFTRCQMVLEKSQETDINIQKLYAEFYDPRLRTEFAIRFAK